MKNEGSKLKRVLPSAVAKKASTSVDKSFRSSSFYNFFRSHRLSEKNYHNGFFGKLLASTKLYTSVKYFKNYFAQSTESSFIVSTIRDFYERLLLCNFRNFVGILIYFSIYSFAVGMAGHTFGHASQETVSQMYSSLVILVISLILLPLKGSLRDIVSRSKILSHLSDTFFMPVYFSSKADAYIPKTHNGIVMIIGTFLGLITAFFEIRTILSILALIFLSLSFFKTPENSLPILVVYGMFASSSNLSFLCLISFFAYLFKVFRGKRNFDLKYFDVLYILFALIVFFSGFNSTGTGFSDGYLINVLSYFVVYFVFRNCIKDQSSSKKIINSMVLAAVVSAILVLYSRFCDWGYVDIIRNYIGVPFESAFIDVFSLCGFLLMLLPFALSSMAVSKYKRGKLFALITAFLSLTAILSTGSKGFVIGVAACILIYVVASFRNPFSSLLTVLIIYAIISVVISNTPFLGSDRFLDISDYTKSVTFTTSEIISDNFVSGIGLGNENFAEIFSAYTHFPEGVVVHSNSILLHIFACFGVFGSIFVIALFVNYYKMQFTSISENRKKNVVSSMISISAVSAISTVLLRGFTDYPLSNHRVLFMLFLIIGFSAAAYYRSFIDYDMLYGE